MKLKLYILLMTLFSIVSAEETFIEEIIGLARPLFIIALLGGSPIWITLIIVGIGKSVGKGASLTKDLFTDDEEEE